jgi:ferredoxin
MDAWLLPRARLADLLSTLQGQGFSVIAPTVREGAVVYEAITSESDLPIGLRDVQEPGRYRLERRDDEAVFGYAAGASSVKRHFHVPEERLFRVHREGKSLRFTPDPLPARKLALFGARGCDLAALRLQDRVLLTDLHRDERYASRRQNVLVVAVHCGAPSGSCFCTSMGTGPRADGPWDLALTELVQGEHRFVVETGSAAGLLLVRELGLAEASVLDRVRAARVPVQAAAEISRRLPTEGLAARLAANPEHPRYADVASRCTSCTSCTMVCPTCFCTTVEDFTELDGNGAERRRRWDSCFTLEFSYLHGGSVRQSTASRYRQWLTHKLSTWHEQFGSSGCVGCGRCITWCPSGIDITEEAGAITQGGVAARKTE